MKNENLIHLKLDYGEAIQSRRDILYIEKSLMVSAVVMEKYYSLRINELNLKVKLHRKIKELITGIKRIQKNIPNIEFSGMSEKEEVEEPIIKTKEYGDSIKSQLQEIQEKLNSLK